MYKNLNGIINAAVDVCFLYTQKDYILYFSNFCISNYALSGSILQLCKISIPVFLYSGSERNLYDQFI